jgi:ribonuclease VapC
VIVDTSALIAIANDEPGRAVFVEMIFNADRVAISAPSLVEASIVLYRLAGGEALTKLSQFLNEANVEVAQFSSESSPGSSCSISGLWKGIGLQTGTKLRRLFFVRLGKVQR